MEVIYSGDVKHVLQYERHNYIDIFFLTDHQSNNVIIDSFCSQ